MKFAKTGDTLPLALTMGEPAGIGTDLAIKIWLKRYECKPPPFVWFGCPDLLHIRARQLDVDIDSKIISLTDAVSDIFDNFIPIFPVKTEKSDCCGTLYSENSTAVIQSIKQAVYSVFDQKCSALVTNPIHKSVLYHADFKHPGHTEYLAALAKQHNGENYQPVMMLVASEIKTVPITIHIPLSQVANALSTQLIIDKTTICAQNLENLFGIQAPRLCVAGLNPHAGESGAIGHEEASIIMPAIHTLHSKGFDVQGPYSADTLFHKQARKNYDAAICMYHDQALIPVKTLAFDKAVNTTLGLPFIRTSPDHGTALNLAGTGQANEASLLAALALAQQMAQKQASL